VNKRSNRDYIKIVNVNFQLGAHPSFDIVNELSCNLAKISTKKIDIEKIIKPIYVLEKLRCLPSLHRNNDTKVILPVVGPREAWLFRASFYGEVIPIIFDCWEKDWKRWKILFKKYKIRLAFLTSSISTAHSREQLPKC